MHEYPVSTETAFQHTRVDFIGKNYQYWYRFFCDNQATFSANHFFPEAQKTLAAQWIANFVFGITIAHSFVRDEKINNDVTVCFLPRKYESHPETQRDELFDLEYMSSNIEYSAVALKRIVAQKYMPVYKPKYDTLFDSLTRFRDKKRVDGLTHPQYVKAPSEEFTLGYLWLKDIYVVNAGWFAYSVADFFNKTDGKKPTAGKIEYDNADDTFFFAGVEEGAHRLYHRLRKRQANQILSDDIIPLRGHHPEKNI